MNLGHANVNISSNVFKSLQQQGDREEQNYQGKEGVGM